MVTRRLENRSILVTGATGAIGRGTAHRLASEGARLALADRDDDTLAALADEIEASGAFRPATLVHDAASAQSNATLVHDAVARMNGLDAVCNVAGIYTKAHSADVSDSEWDRVLQINLSSVFTICREAIGPLAQTGGCVVNTSSLAALEGLAYSTAYAVSKAGVIALTKSLAAEYAATGIRFNAICPGGIRSSMSTVPAVTDADPDLTFRRSKLRGFEGGLGEPKDIAAAFAYLVSEDARFVSGSVMVIDGAQFLL
ncbi:SDR family NAD(P)-dependent oxidoreductase [Oricola sp.]|uniref:SDR family NAD(P)-dependent oxidoreductase n=1 Tax=Oricola sp. TaxID=1979950 RepID=UPI0025CBB9C5|nr:SDR family NAD(P)-dependent oxidoreductase [Oricola sp.]MCI5074486.1 SDR family oxidoreductase [Oricola sp.]